MKKLIQKTSSDKFELVELRKNDAFTNTWIIAQGTRNTYKAIIKQINTFKKDFLDLGRLESYPVKRSELSHCQSLNSKRGRPVLVYDLNEEQAIFLITLLGNNREVVEFKKRLSMEFVKAKDLLRERETPEWKEARTFGKKIRRKFTDTIQRYIELAKAQGHDGSARFAYSNFSKLVEKPFGKRDLADGEQLVLISATEHILDKTISPMVDAGVDAKEIYGVCKERAKNTVCMLTA